MTLPVTISVGVARSTDFPSRSVDAIVDEADTALYAAKAAGRNCVRMATPAPARDTEVILHGEPTSLQS
jgi:PleD family two-component response regulator